MPSLNAMHCCRSALRCVNAKGGAAADVSSIIGRRSGGD
jgi:hypothetical protein